jgi:hypothetical protein
MKERRKRLLRSLYKKELTTGPLRKGKDELSAEFEKEYELKEQQKNVIIQALSALELEDMLRTSTKNVAHEVVSCLVEVTGRGVLTDIIRFLTTSQHNMLNDHLSILDSTDITTKTNNYGEEDPEDAEDSESFYNTKSSMNTSGIRIKVRKNSIDPYAKKKTWMSKNKNITNAARATAYNAKQNKFHKKTNEDIKVDTEAVRAGSPLNYVREMNKQRLNGNQGSGTHGSAKNSLIVLHPVDSGLPSNQ